mmetsp:Transcript_31013/g.56805  ORF Transcript_31013/g.56805 Transcript_31013/m.56805 type:complete len:662 (+) Transcript_31013:589-2574(+)
MLEMHGRILLVAFSILRFLFSFVRPLAQHYAKLVDPIASHAGGDERVLVHPAPSSECGRGVRDFHQQVLLHHRRGGHAISLRHVHPPGVDPTPQIIQSIDHVGPSPLGHGIDVGVPSLEGENGLSIACLEFVFGDLLQVHSLSFELREGLLFILFLEPLGFADGRGDRKHDGAIGNDCHAFVCEIVYHVRSPIFVRLRILLQVSTGDERWHQLFEIIQWFFSLHLFFRHLYFPRHPRRVAPQRAFVFPGFDRATLEDGLDCRHGLIWTRHDSKQHHPRALPLKVPLQIVPVILPIQTQIARPAKLPERRPLVEKLQQLCPPTPARPRRKVPQRIHAPHRRRPSLAAQPAQVKLIPVLREVLPLRVHDALGRQSVPSRASHLLVVLLDRLGRSPVHDASYVRLVDSHSEGDGRDDDRDPADEEVEVGAGARAEGEAGVVRLHEGRGEAFGPLRGEGRVVAGAVGAEGTTFHEPVGEGPRDPRRDILHLPLRRAVDDGAASRSTLRSVRGVVRSGRPAPLRDGLRQLVDHGVERSRRSVPRLPSHDDLEIGPIERLLRDGGVRPHAQIGDDVPLHPRNGRGRQRHQRNARQHRIPTTAGNAANAGTAQCRSDFEEGGTKIVSPLRNAVTLVHGDAAYFFGSISGSVGGGGVHGRESVGESALG